jgi:hypothetical protein
MVEKLMSQWKFVAQVVAFVAAGAVGVFDDGHISGVLEWTVLAVALANAVNVFVTPELSAGVGRLAKGLTTVVITAAGAITPAVAAGGLDASETWMVVSVAVGAVVALVAPNSGYRYAQKAGTRYASGGHVPPVTSAS